MYTPYNSPPKFYIEFTLNSKTTNLKGKTTEFRFKPEDSHACRSGVPVACIHRASSVIDWWPLYFLTWTDDIDRRINGIMGKLSWWWSSCPHLTYHEARHMSHLENLDNSKLYILVFKIKLFKTLYLNVAILNSNNQHG